VYWTVFAGPGGIPAAHAHRALLVLGVLTALLGAVMCWHQRHLKRLLAFSTVAHTGLFLVGIATLTPDGFGGVALYVLAHAGVKAALFACAGILLDRFGNVDEHQLHGKGRQVPWVGVLFGIGGLALAGLPPFGTALGKAVTEEAGGGWATALFVLVSAATGGAVLRVTARVFLGLGPRPAEDFEETTGEDEEPESRGGLLSRVPGSMFTVPAVLLAGALAAGLVPSLWTTVGAAADAFTDHAGYTAAVLHTGGPVPPAVHTPAPHWTQPGVLLGLLATATAALLALATVRRPVPHGPARWLRPLRRLHSGHVGDYVAWFLAGTTLLAALVR
jgi:multicomponent Na+:H+ antiporter subunit D